jgi:Flp pilus assembly protein CpaB
MRPFDWQKWLLTLVVLTLTLGGTFYLFSLNQPVTTLYVPGKDFSTYHLISASDLVTTTLPTAVLPSKSLLEESDLVGRYTIQPLSAEKPVTEAQLVPVVDEKYVLDTTAVSIPATAAMAYNGQLTPSAIVTVWTVTDTGQAEPLLDEALVLDVQKVEQSESEADANPYVIVLAIPRLKQAELLTAMIKHTIWFTIQQQ